MTLYFEKKVQFLDDEAVSTVSAWHSNDSIFAVASYSQNRGGSVTIFHDTGEPLKNVTFPVHAIAQATTLCWHPDKQLLVSGWETGELHVWHDGNKEFFSINGPHKSPILSMEFSEKGGRMVTADSMGVLTGWRCDIQGEFLTMFNHDLRDPIVHLTFRMTVQNIVNTEITNLARAAVSGDENALDALTNWRPRTAARNLIHAGVRDNHCFYATTQSGLIYYLNQSGTCTEVYKSTGSPISQILWHRKREAVVALSADMTVSNFLVESNGTLTELDRVKLSGRVPGQNGAISWAGGNSLAILTGDFTVRIWDIDNSDNFLLPMEPPSEIKKTGVKSLLASPAKGSMEVFSCISYCFDNQTLCAGTNQGNVYTWKRISGNNLQPTIDSDGHQSLEHLWQLNNVSTVGGSIKHCTWGISETVKPCILVNCLSVVYVLKEQPLMSAFCREIWAIQKTGNKIQLEHESLPTNPFTVQAELLVTDLCLTECNLCLTDGKSVSVYRIDQNPTTLSAKHINTFLAECIQLLLYNETVIIVGPNDIRTTSFGGVILRELYFSDVDGRPIGASLTKQYMVAFSFNGFLKIYDVGRYEPKLLCQPKSGYDLVDSFGEIIDAKCNATGTHVALIIANENLLPDGNVYLWNFEKDVTTKYEWITGTVPRLPVNLYWDVDDGRIVASELRCIQQSKQSVDRNLSFNSDPVDQYSESQIGVMYVVEKSDELNLLELMGMKIGEKLVSVSIPNIITLKLGQMISRPLRDFHGLNENSDLQTRRTILDFSIYVADNNMDQAFRCIRSIQSEAVWKNLARMCVQTGRLDVAKVCLGHLKKPRSVRALRKAIDDEILEPEARIAVLAIELDMIEEAENLYKKCGRYDLLNKLLQACGRYEEAINIAEQMDRIHLKNVYYKYAEWLKSTGDRQLALQYYEKSLNSVANVTQMLIDDTTALTQHMQKVSDPKMLKWWAQYIESTGDMESALKVYQKAEDWFSQVRILCFLGHLSRADLVARHSGDKSACYHMARHYENIGKIADAIQFYMRAQTYTNAIRVCKENDLADELWNVANSSRPRDKAVAAAYFEETSNYKRAVELYHRAGMLHKAVEMAFASQQPETLQVIAAELDSNSDPELVNRCADFFLTVEQPLKAVQLLANNKQFERSLQICSDRGVPLTESLSDILTPTKDELPEPERIKILTTLGNILQEQGDYHSATKKFTQAGDKVRAMKSLLKSGDTEKIVFFAGMSRQKDIYIMAANYLQALDWQNDAKILKNIVTFYSKGQAYDLLANFHANCAQMEVDEYRNYEKAIDALQEALRCLTKVGKVEKIVVNLQNTILDVRQMLELQESMERGAYPNVIRACKMMLANPERLPVRHIYINAMLIEAYVLSKQYSEGLTTLRDLTRKVPDWRRRRLFERSLIEKLANESGIEFETIWNMGQSQRMVADDTDDGNVDEIEEDVVY